MGRNKMIESRHHKIQHHAHSESSHSETTLKSFILSNNYDTTPIDAQYLENIHLCSNKPLLMIYLSILRDRETKNNEKFQEITHKILVLMFNEIFDYHLSGNKCWNEVQCVSPLDITYGSLMCQRGIYGVCLNDCCQNALQNLLDSFQPIIRSVIGTLKVEESFVEDKDGIIRSNRQAVALMPKDIDKRIVVIFHDIISPKNTNNELQSTIDALLKLGAIDENIIVISLISSRKSCISLIQRFKKLHIWSACIDAVNSQNSSKLIPGIGVFHQRYSRNQIQKKNKKKQKKRHINQTSSSTSSTTTTTTQSPSQKEKEKESEHKKPKIANQN